MSSTVRSASRGPKTIKSKVLPKSRKTQHSIDTNLLSYDRTDPFAAFNVLLKLLGTLPSRVGGCQYKLSPDEHRLSMHLLTIVEPFVGLTHSKRTLTRQPTEILDAIAFHIESKYDLLNLALSCRRLHAVVCPRHLEYRVIRCKASAVSVWNHLIVHRSLARNVRRLEVIDERSAEASVIPAGIMVRDTDLESTDDELGMHAKQERFLVSALAKMSALRSFTWSCNHSPILIDNIWPTLVKCRSLCEVDIRDNLVFGAYNEEGEGQAALKRQWVLPELKSITLQSTKHTYGAAKQPDLARISGMLNHTPNVQSLAVRYVSPRFPAPPSPRADALLLARYPCLTSLTLTNLTLASPHPPTTFLSAHPRLEVLRLDLLGTGSKMLELPPGSLPNLKELEANRDVAAVVLSVTQSIETLKGVSLAGAGSEADARFLNSLIIGGKNLHRVELARGGWSEAVDVRKLVACTPGLRWLDIGPGRRGQAVARITGPATNVVEWANILSMLPELSTFHGVKFFYEVSPTVSSSANAISVSATNSSSLPTPSLHPSERLLGPSDKSRMRKNDEVASVLGRRCPKLRRVDHWEEGAGRVVVLLREGAEKEKSGRVRWEVRRVKV